jgi:hypothetical protein
MAVPGLRFLSPQTSSGRRDGGGIRGAAIREDRRTMHAR